MIFVLLSLCAVINAVPAKKEWRTFLQPDGTTIELMLVGDENLHYYITKDNIPVIEEEDSKFCYARNVGFSLKSTGVLAHEARLRSSLDKANVSSLEDVEHARYYFKAKSASNKHYSLGMKSSAYLGKKKGLIILANFSDKQFWDYSESDNGKATWNRYNDLVNKEGYTNEEYGAIGSVHDYFLDQSYGKFDLSFDVMGPVNLENAVSYYGNNVNGDDFHAGQMIYHACQLVDSLVDFNDYDWDGDGIAEEVFVLYAGYGEATGGGAKTVWPHMWSLVEASKEDDIPEKVEFDGCQIDVYACSNELYSRSGYTEMGIGVFCHEFSHCFGLPDLYDTGYSNVFGMGMWDLLDAGSYNGPLGLGWVPAGYSSYERNFVGWMDFEELEKDTLVIDQKPLTEQGSAYVIYNDGNRNEYYLLENRTKKGWDAYLPGKGLLAIHVDYDPDIWDSNIVNTVGKDNSHQRFTVFHASNSDFGGNEPYPYNGNDSLTDNSVPQALLYNENLDGSFLMHKPVTGIAINEENDYVSFCFKNEVEKHTASINDVENSLKNDMADIYTLKGTLVVPNFRGDNLNFLPNGVYIVKRNGKNAVKILIRK